MNSDYVKKRIEKIRSLISEARHDEAFADLENFIAEIDGEKVENIRERDLLDQLISVKSRYNFFKQQVLKGLQEGQTELNQISAALLSLTNEVNKIGEENPKAFKPDEEEQEFYAEMAATAPLTATHNINDSLQDGSQNSGCLLAINNKNTNVNVEIKDFNWSAFFFKVAFGLVLVAAAIFFMTRGCANKSVDPVSPPVISPEPAPDPGGATKDSINRGGGNSTDVKSNQQARGKNCKELQLSAGKICDLADYISNVDNALLRKFELSDVSFKKNSLDLSDRSKANQQINDLVKLLKAYPGLDLTIYGYTVDGENDVIKGVNDKEDGLDNIRAKKIFGFLNDRGISKKRMDYIGDTDNDRGDSRIWIKME